MSSNKSKKLEVTAGPSNSGIAKVVYIPIGIVLSSFIEPGDPKTTRSSESILALDEKYLGALDGLKNFRYILVIYHIDRSMGYRERVHPMGDLSRPER
jgi:tRNA (Thr-GGU) A37 N-methylase